MTAIIFDLDGTLVDSAQAICDIGTALMVEIGQTPLTPAQTRSYIGNGAARFLERALADRAVICDANRMRQLLARFEELYAEGPGEANIPMPGANEALTRLLASGARLAICTNKPGAPTQIVLRALGWQSHFSAVIAGDSLPERKPHPMPLLEASRLLDASPALYVGDSDVDAATAQAAGLPFFLYTEGYRKSPVAELPHEVAFSDFAELPDLIAAHLAAQGVPAG